MKDDTRMTRLGALTGKSLGEVSVLTGSCTEELHEMNKDMTYRAAQDEIANHTPRHRGERASPLGVGNHEEETYPYGPPVQHY